jgi:RES domain-containing protein
MRISTETPDPVGPVPEDKSMTAADTATVPSVTAIRIVQKKWVASAMTGEGSALHPGRWNLKGEPMVYLAEHVALAAWEVYIHFRDDVSRYWFLAVQVTIPGKLVETVAEPDLPAGWEKTGKQARVQAFGSEWLRSRRSCVLKVPSAVNYHRTIPQFNYLVNPLHVDFQQILVSKAVPFRFDRRLQKP